MDQVVILGTRREGLAVLDVGPNGSAALFEMTSSGLAAATWVHEHPDFSRLVDFLAELERHWRGWEGTRERSSLEGEMAIRAER